VSPTSLRWSALPLGLLALAVRVAESLWLQPLTWEMSDRGRLLVLLTGHLVAIGVPLGIFALLFLWDRRSPARFTIGQGRLIVPPSPLVAGSQAILWMSFGGGMVLTERDGDSMRLVEAEWRASVIGVAVFAAVALAFLLVRRPLLHLDPEGLTIRRLWRTTRLAWDQLYPGGPRPISKHERSMRIYLKGAPVAGTWPGVDIPVRWLHVDPAFLADTIRHYVEHPEDRATIGTGEAGAR
jgi:hypothetical protein